MARKKIAAMQILDDDDAEDKGDDEDDDDDEQFKRLFSHRRSKKKKTPALFSARRIEDISDASVGDCDLIARLSILFTIVCLVDCFESRISFHSTDSTQTTNDRSRRRG